MGFNVSNNTRRLNIVQQPSADFLDWHFLATCPRCLEQRPVPVTVLASRNAGNHLVGETVERLRCGAPVCGAMPSSIVILNRLHRVILHGPGAMG